MSRLNEARDWDVFITETLPAMSQACPAVDGFDVLERAARERRRKAHDTLRTAIADPRTGRFQIALGLWIEQAHWRSGAAPDAVHVLDSPGRRFASEVLRKLRHKALKRGRGFRKLSPEERHELRIALKKLRYASELFLPLLKNSKSKRRYAETLAELQDHLGRSNDLSVMEGLVQRMTRGKLPMAGHRAAGALLGWRAANLNRDDPNLLSAWKHFQNADLP
jgi:CHAD domain-containing protein